MSRVKNPKYEAMSLEELKANMEKSIVRQTYISAHKKSDIRLQKQLKKGGLIIRFLLL